MAQNKHEIVTILQTAGIRPRHRFGQNFMIDQNLVRIVAEAAHIAPGELVIEVGPGTGTLTEEILSRGAQVVAVEIDRDLARVLREKFAQQTHFELIEGDALDGKHEINAELLQRIRESQARGQIVKLVANLPYNIASPLIIDLLIAGTSLLTFTVQKEVADRLRAAPGSKNYGVLSIMAQILSDVEVLRTLPPQAFWPAPKIESALVRMTWKAVGMLGSNDERAIRAFGQFVQALFSARRKMLRKSLAQMNVESEKPLAAAGIDPQSRPEDLSPEQLIRLHQSLPPCPP